MIKPWGWQIAQVLQGLTTLAQALHLDLIIHMTTEKCLYFQFQGIENILQAYVEKSIHMVYIHT